MKKILRLSLVALFAMIGNFALAEDIIWSEDFTNYSSNDVPEGGTYNYKCTNGGSSTKIYAESLAGGTSPELLISKSNGSFSATINLGGKTGEMTISFKANKSYISVTASDEDIIIGDKTQTGNDYSYPVTVPAGKESITLTFTNTNTSTNTRFDNVKLYQGVSKKPAGISWGTSARTVTIGSAENVFPTLTNENNLTIAYSSSDTEIATIDASTGEIELISAGNTIITAKFEGNDEYESAEVSYTLTVKDAPTVDISNTPETAYTVAQAIDLITAGEGLETKVYIKGIITSIKSLDVSKYTNAQYYIGDTQTDANTLYVYNGKSLGNKDFTSDNEIKVGDNVIIYGQLTKYGTTNEINSGNYIYSLNGQTTSGIKDINADKDNANAPVYNLAGQRVSKDTKGILIQNGKKFINK